MADRNLRIRMILEASDKATRPLRDMAGGSSKLAQSLKATRDRLQDLEKAQADVAGFRSLRAGLRDTTQELGSARARILAARDAIASTDTPTRKMTAELTRAEGAAKKLEDTQRSQAASLRAIRAGFREAGVSARDLTSYEQRLGHEVTETTAALRAQERRFMEASARHKRMASARAGFSDVQDRAAGIAAGGAAGIAAGAAVGAPLFSAARGAMSLEEGMAGVAKVTGLTDGPLAAMQDRIVSLSTKIPMTAVELSNIAAAAGAAGVGMDKFGRPLPSQAEDLVAFTDAAARMGIAFDMTAEDAGETMAKWRQAFKMTQPEVEALGDRVNALTNKFGGKAANVAEIVTRIGPLGKVAGIAAPQVSALASSLASIGVENEIAGTGIKNLLLTMTKGTAATKGQSAAFQSLGLDAEKVAAAMQIDASGTIIDVLERTAKLKPEKQASLLSELFGTESVGAIAPLLTNLYGLKQRLQLVGNQSQYAGSMTGEFLSRINTTTGATDLAKNGLQAVNISLGQALLPTIKSVAHNVSALSARMRVFAQAHPGIAKGALIVVGGIALLLAVLGAGGILIAGIMGPIAILNAGLIAMGVAGGLASVGLLPIIGTVAAVLAGVALLGAGAYLLYSRWGEMGDFFSGLWGGIETRFASARDTVTGTFGSMWGGISALFSMSIADVFSSIAYFTGYALGALLRFGSSASSWLTGTLPGLLVSGWNAAWSGLTGAIGAAWTWLSTRLPAMLVNAWSLAWTGFKTAMRAAFVTLPAMFFDFGAMIIKGLWNGIKSAPGRLFQGGMAMAHSLAGGFRKGNEIKSPSRVFKRLGGYVTEGLALGIDDGGDGPVRRLDSISARMTKAVTSGMAAPALSLAPLAAAAAPGAGTALAAPTLPPIEINIHGAPGQSEQQLAELVGEKVRQALAGFAPRRSNGYGDNADYGEA